MEYPIISEYIEAIEMAEDNLEVLNYLRPVLDDNGKVVMSRGNFAVVFKMRDERDGKLYALKCFLKEQKGRAEAYHKICEALRYEDAPYFTKFEYYEDELFVNSSRMDKEKFPVLLMDWVEGFSSEEIDDEMDYVVEKASGNDRSEYYDFLIRFKNGCPLYFKFGDNSDEVMVCVPRYIYDGEIYIYYYNDDEKPFGRVRIPSVINYENRKYKVVKIDNCTFENCTSLYQIEIPNSVREIGEYAFERCTSLVEIEIPNSVRDIGSGIFSYCTSLVEIEISNFVQEISNGAFLNCTSLVKIEIPNSVKVIGSGTFSSCTSLVKIEIPNSVKEIGRGAFSDCTSLVEIEISNSVKEIGISAFSSCTSLTQIGIPNSVKIIDEYVFDKCASLTQIEIPNSVRTIGRSAFNGCTSLLRIEIPYSVQMIGCGTFANTSVQIINHSPNYIIEEGVLYTRDKKEIIYVPNDIISLEIPNSVQKIGRKAFSRCISLVQMKIPNSVQTIGEWAFEGCISLAQLEISDSVQEIERWAFSGCASLVKIKIPNSVQKIGEWTFSGCTSLIQIELSNAIDVISANIFSECISLVEIVIPNWVRAICDGAFSGCTSLTQIKIPNSVQTIGNYAFNSCTSLKDVMLHNQNVKYYDHTFPLHTKIKYLDSSVIEGVQSINDGLLIQFQNGCQLCVKFGDNEGEVLLYAPKKNYYCYLDTKKRPSRKMRIPPIINYQNREYKIVGIEDSTFYGCTSLTQIEIPNSVREIGREAFRGCTSLKDVILHNRNVKYSEGLFRSFPMNAKITYVDD